MGMDIKIFREKLVSTDLVKEEWTTLDQWNKRGECTNPCFSGRNYELFSLLADAQPGFPYSLAARGAPEDCCPEVWDQIQDYSICGHTHSWLHLHELIGLHDFVKCRPATTSPTWTWTQANLRTIISSFEKLVDPSALGYRVVFFFNS